MEAGPLKYGGRIADLKPTRLVMDKLQVKLGLIYIGEW